MHFLRRFKVNKAEVLCHYVMPDCILYIVVFVLNLSIFVNENWKLKPLESSWKWTKQAWNLQSIWCVAAPGSQQPVGSQLTWRQIGPYRVCSTCIYICISCYRLDYIAQTILRCRSTRNYPLATNYMLRKQQESTTWIGTTITDEVKCKSFKKAR